MYFFLEQKISWSLWKVIPLIKNLQFSFRLNALIILVTAIIAAIVWENINLKRKNTWLVIIASAAILPTLLNWGNRKMLPVLTDLEIEQGIPANILFNPYGPGTPIWLDPNNPWQSNFPASPLEIVSGKAHIDNLSRSANSHKYRLVATTPVKLRENTTYFPGWNVFANNNQIPLDPLTYSSGIIHFELPTNTFLVEVKFMDTNDRKYGILASLGVIVCLLVALIVDKVHCFRNYRLFKK